MGWSPLRQSMSNVMLGKKLPITRRVRISIKHVHLVTYITAIKHVHERASFCNNSKARIPGLAIGRKVMSSPADAHIYF